MSDFTRTYSARYKAIISKKTECSLPQPGGVCVDKTNETTGLLGDGSYAGTKTQVRQMVNAVRYHKGGKVFYGDDPRMYIHNDAMPLPVVNGLRGGIVPRTQRTNRF